MSIPGGFQAGRKTFNLPNSIGRFFLLLFTLKLKLKIKWTVVDSWMWTRVLWFNACTAIAGGGLASEITLWRHLHLSPQGKVAPSRNNQQRKRETRSEQTISTLISIPSSYAKQTSANRNAGKWGQGEMLSLELLVCCLLHQRSIRQTEGGQRRGSMGRDRDGELHERVRCVRRVSQSVKTAQKWTKYSTTHAKDSHGFKLARAHNTEESSPKSFSWFLSSITTQR